MRLVESKSCLSLANSALSSAFSAEISALFFSNSLILTLCSAFSASRLAFSSIIYHTVSYVYRILIIYFLYAKKFSHNNYMKITQSFFIEQVLFLKIFPIEIYHLFHFPLTQY